MRASPAGSLDAQESAALRPSWAAIVLLAAVAFYFVLFVGPWAALPGGFALLWIAAAWRAESARGSERTWPLPLLWVLVVPTVTVGLQIGLLGLITDGYQYGGVLAGGPAGACEEVRQSAYDKQWSCPLGAALPTLLPGLLNLVPFAGLASSAPRARAAAGVAGGLGLVRLLVPILMYASQGSDVTIIGSWQAPAAMGSVASATASAALWFASLGVALAFGAWRGRGQLGPIPPPPSPSASAG
jgi:hypothetical protein